MDSFLHSHQLAKKLNNTAAVCIETGQYERGISCLVEALQLSDRQNVPEMTALEANGCVCQCRHCSLDECIVYSECTPVVEEVKRSNSSTPENEDVGSTGYIHRRPIRISPQSVQGGHNMGVTLSLIITFNLALAHHLSALAAFAISDNIGASTSPLQRSMACKTTFQKILHLYELAYRWQIELEEDRISKQQQFGGEFSHVVQLDASPVTSLRFNMIISNNLSQIHRLVQNHTKHQRCLEHLLATMMFVVVVDGNNTQQTSSTTSTSSTGDVQQSPTHNQGRYMDFEGFLLNATPLILQEQCAAAA